MPVLPALWWGPHYRLHHRARGLGGAGVFGDLGAGVFLVQLLHRPAMLLGTLEGVEQLLDFVGHGAIFTLHVEMGDLVTEGERKREGGRRRVKEGGEREGGGEEREEGKRGEREEEKGRRREGGGEREEREEGGERGREEEREGGGERGRRRERRREGEEEREGGGERGRRREREEERGGGGERGRRREGEEDRGGGGERGRRREREEERGGGGEGGRVEEACLGNTIYQYTRAHALTHTQRKSPIYTHMQQQKKTIARQMECVIEIRVAAYLENHQSQSHDQPQLAPPSLYGGAAAQGLWRSSWEP